jgi:hypothetical protein
MVLDKQNYHQRGESTMAQGVLPFKYESEKKTTGMTALAGLPVYLDLAGGKLPSADFGENAVWWWIMLLAFSLHALMKKLALGASWQPKRMKAVRFSLINLPGRVVKRSRRLIIRLTKNHPY